MDTNILSKEPPLPPEILKAANDNSLAVFIGAGVSRLVGCKSWEELAFSLVKRCHLTKKADSSPCINFKESETISQIKDHKETITICYHILKQNNLEDIFFEELKESLKWNPELIKNQNIYDELYGLHGLFITTNADTLFDKKFEAQYVAYKLSDFSPTNIDRNRLYHIHGSIRETDSLIFTVSQYIKRYRNPVFRLFLEAIIGKSVVLFIGYGLAEFELLDFLITKFDSNKKKDLKHFILLPFYKGEINILRMRQFYYGSMGITVLGYEKDEKGYHQLYDVIKNWNKEINQTSTYLHDSFKEIDEIVK
jgi:SIR2-like protein